MGSGECFPWFIRPSDSNGVTLFPVTQDPSLQPQTVQLRQIATENIGLVLGGAGPKDSNDWMTHGLLLVQSTVYRWCGLCTVLTSLSRFIFDQIKLDLDPGQYCPGPLIMFTTVPQTTRIIQQAIINTN